MALAIRVSEEFTKTPGARYKTDGKYSGEQFLEELLKPRFEVAVESNVNLIVDLDGGYGYATSFLEQSFGGLARLFGVAIVEAIVRIKSDDEPGLISEIAKYISNANNKLQKVGEHA
jgi:hypothetical protein